MKKTFLLLSLLLAMGLVFAQTPFSATYTFGTDGNVASFTYNGTIYDGIEMGSIVKVGVTSTSSSGNFRANNWPLGATSESDNFTGSVDLGKYIGFTITAATGYKFSVSSITFGIGRSATGTRQSQWRGSADSYTALLSSYTTINDGLTNDSGVLTNPDLNSSWTGNVLSVGSAYTDITESVGFRYYLYNAESTAGTAGLQGPITITGTYELVAGNNPPIITNIVQTPSTDILSTTTVSVSADVTDSDGTVALVELHWGTVSGNYPNTITMSTGTKATYTTESDIPAQSDGTTVYYVIYADDDEEDSTTSAEQSYTVRDPATTTIPYSETFDADLGDCYVYSVSGDTKYWEWSTYNCAYMNGHNSGETEEDWLILPGIDFTAYGDLQMSFETWYNYGILDDLNYLKLYYSTDYVGVGDPNVATWTELAFTYPSGSYSWTPSGLIDLSGITGTSVWFGFKYLYEPGNYRTWGVDNILIEEAPLDPIIYASTDILSGFTYEFDIGRSAEQDFTVSGANLTGDIVLTAPTDYELALVSGGPFAASQVLTPVEGTVAETTIYVRLMAGLAIGTYNDELIDISSAGATSLTITLNGEVTSPPAPDEPVALPGSDVDSESFMAHWDPVDGATGYYLDVYTMEEGYASDLFISEYIEGSSSNKYIEVYNGTGTTVDLTNYDLQLYSNGSASTTPRDLSGTIAPGEAIVYQNSSAALTLPDGVTAIDNLAVNFNGDDAVALYYDDGTKAAYFVDIFGCIGEDPGSAWTSGAHSTVDKTLVRKSSVTGGISTNPASGFPTLETEWDVYPQDTADYLGSHTFSGATITYVTGYENLDVGNVTSYPVTGLDPNTTYHYVVRAYNDYGTSGDSNPTEVTTEEEGPVPVELASFTATISAQNYVTLTWVTHTETSLSGYYVQRANTDQLSEAILVSPMIDAMNTSQMQTYTFTDEELFESGTYYYWLQSVDLNGSTDYHGPVSVYYNVNGENNPPEIPAVTELKAVYPNPFNPVAFIPYSIATQTEVSFKIYNSRGQVVRSFDLGSRIPGEYRITWDGKDFNGNMLANGVYHIRMTAGEKSYNRKAVLIK
jgi:hypothetical protein